MAKIISEVLLTRDKAATALSEYGYPVSKLTNYWRQRRRTVYRRFGKRVLYRWDDLDVGGRAVLHLIGTLPNAMWHDGLPRRRAGFDQIWPGSLSLPKEQST